eukprot:14399863-Ditylum_brightwellii.AAC.1
MSSSSADSTWATCDADCSDNGACVAESIQKGTAICVSDGSYKLGGGTAACIIEGERPLENRISATATVPGSLDIHNAYRAELTEIYMLVQIDNKLCLLHNIDKGCITIACDGIEALRKAMATDVSFSPLSSQFD